MSLSDESLLPEMSSPPSPPTREIGIFKQEQHPLIQSDSKFSPLSTHSRTAASSARKHPYERRHRTGRSDDTTSTSTSTTTASSRKRQRQRAPPKQTKSIQVIVRIRPLSRAEKKAGAPLCIRPIVQKKIGSLGKPSVPDTSKAVVKDQEHLHSSLSTTISSTSSRTSASNSSSTQRKRTPHQTSRKKSSGLGTRAKSEVLSSATSSTSSKTPLLSKSQHSKQSQRSLQLPSSNQSYCSSSLVIGVEQEDKARFEYDHVLGPSLSQQQCYERAAIGETVKMNITKGVNTTIVAVGYNKSGKSYTMSGGWTTVAQTSNNNGCKTIDRTSKTSSSSTGAAVTEEMQLTDKAGILPRAIYDLFRTCHGRRIEDSMCVMMAYYMVECSKGKPGGTKDLLSRFRHPSKQAWQGVTWLQVGSPQGVKRLMDRASQQRAQGRVQSGHMFCSFLVLPSSFQARIRDGGGLLEEKELVARLSFIKLAMSSTSAASSNGRRLVQSKGTRYQIRDVLCNLCQESATDQHNTELIRRFDDVIQDDTSTILIGCISPVVNEMKRSAKVLQWIAMANHATLCSESESKYECATSATEADSLLTESPRNVLCDLSNLKSMMEHADEAARIARESSASLDAAATKWRSHRHRLSTDTVLATLSNKNVQRLFGERQYPGNQGINPKTQLELPEGGSTQNRAPRQTRQRHGPKLLRENSEMKERIGCLQLETSKQKERLESLEFKFEGVSKQLEEEQQISAELEHIRNILKRKSLLQESRIVTLERERWDAMQAKKLLEQELNGMRLMATGESKMKQRALEVQAELEKQCIELSEKLQNALLIVAERRGQKNRNGGVDSVARVAPLLELGSNSTQARASEDGSSNVNLLSILDNSADSASIFYDGDDAVSIGSIENLKHLLPIGRHSSEVVHSICTSATESVCSPAVIPSVSRDGPISNMNEIGELKECSCQTSLLSSCNVEDIQFYLPNISVNCFCGKQQHLPVELDVSEDITAILRPWQAEFLSSVGITTIREFMAVYQKSERQLAVLMLKWRDQHDRKKMSKGACAVALYIWFRTCTNVISTKELPHDSTGEKPRPDVLELCSFDSGRLSSLGFGSAVLGFEGRQED